MPSLTPRKLSRQGKLLPVLQWEPRSSTNFLMTTLLFVSFNSSRFRVLQLQVLLKHCYSLIMLTLNIYTEEISHSIYIKINLWQLCQSQILGSVVRALALYRGTLGSIPSHGWGNFQLCFSLAVASCHKSFSYSFAQWLEHCYCAGVAQIGIPAMALEYTCCSFHVED